MLLKFFLMVDEAIFQQMVGILMSINHFIFVILLYNVTCSAQRPHPVYNMTVATFLGDFFRRSVALQWANRLLASRLVFQKIKCWTCYGIPNKLIDEHARNKKGQTAATRRNKSNYIEVVLVTFVSQKGVISSNPIVNRHARPTVIWLLTIYENSETQRRQTRDSTLWKNGNRMYKYFVPVWVNKHHRVPNEYVVQCQNRMVARRNRLWIHNIPRWDHMLG